MDPHLGFDILINGTRRSFRDRLYVAYDVARYFKSENPKAIVEIVERSTGQKSVMLADGRLS